MAAVRLKDLLKSQQRLAADGDTRAQASVERLLKLAEDTNQVMQDGLVSTRGTGLNSNIISLREDIKDAVSGRSTGGAIPAKKTLAAAMTAPLPIFDQNTSGLLGDWVQTQAKKTAARLPIRIGGMEGRALTREDFEEAKRETQKQTSALTSVAENTKMLSDVVSTLREIKKSLGNVATTQGGGSGGGGGGGGGFDVPPIILAGNGSPKAPSPKTPPTGAQPKGKLYDLGRKLGQGRLGQAATTVGRGVDVIKGAGTAVGSKIGAGLQVLKRAPIVGTAISVGMGGYHSYSGWTDASDEEAAELAEIEKRRQSGEVSPLEANKLKQEAVDLADVKQSESVGGGVGLAGGALAGGMVGASLGSVVPIVGTVIGGAIGAGVGAMAGTQVGQDIGRWGAQGWQSARNFFNAEDRTAEGSALDQMQQAVGGQGTKPIAEMSNLEQLNKETTVPWYRSSDPQRKKYEGLIKQGATFTPEEAAILKQNLDVVVPKENIRTQITTAESSPVQSQEQIILSLSQLRELKKKNGGTEYDQAIASYEKQLEGFASAKPVDSMSRDEYVRAHLEKNKDEIASSRDKISAEYIFRHQAENEWDAKIKERSGATQFGVDASSGSTPAESVVPTPVTPVTPTSRRSPVDKYQFIEDYVAKRADHIERLPSEDRPEARRQLRDQAEMAWNGERQMPGTNRVVAGEPVVPQQPLLATTQMYDEMGGTRAASVRPILVAGQVGDQIGAASSEVAQLEKQPVVINNSQPIVNAPTMVSNTTIQSHKPQPRNTDNSWQRYELQKFQASF